jgi:2-oxoglutarate dehydrogenase complex dehydrogenase (E1) component-like enzyme
MRESATRVVLCTGKIAIDLLKRREQIDAPVAVVRVEQLYPLPEHEIARELERYPNAASILWVQEEPENMGAWYFMKNRLSDEFHSRWPLRAICRPESASPATGSKKTHKIEQDELLDAAMDPEFALRSV